MRYENEPSYILARNEREGEYQSPDVPSWEGQDNAAQKEEKANLRELDRRIHEPVQISIPKKIKGKRKRGKWADELRASWAIKGRSK